MDFEIDLPLNSLSAGVRGLACRVLRLETISCSPGSKALSDFLQGIVGLSLPQTSLSFHDVRNADRQSGVSVS